MVLENFGKGPKKTRKKAMRDGSALIVGSGEAA